uniref:Uncharacterized protein n=1 Tax=uncultured delta proteobacterium HF4000_08N17 TaxID=710836 RepID=E0XVF1_9DELT|nr:hypothetical protein [uncultured delta proteobacterium HF4000_08N17]
MRMLESLRTWIIKLLLLIQKLYRRQSQPILQTLQLVVSGIYQNL